MVSASHTLFQLLPSQAASGTPEITRETYGSVLQAYLKSLWDFMREHNERGTSLPLPSYVYVAFTNPAMAHPKPRHSDLTCRVMIHCIRALVVNKLAAVVNSRTDPIGDEELACLAAILDLQSSDVELCLRQPGTIELVVMASLAFGYLDSEGAIDVPPDAHDVLQDTLDIISQSLPAQEDVELDHSQTAALVDISGDKFVRVIVLCFYDLLKTCRRGNSSLTEEVRTSCLRTCLKSIWHISKVYYRVFDRLPLYFPVLLASPEVTEHLQTEPDSAARMIGCCVGALIADKVLDDLLAHSHIPSNDSYYATQLASIFLGTDPREGQSEYDQLRILTLRRFVSVMAENLAILFSSAMPPDVLMIASHTLHDLTINLDENVYVTRIDWLGRFVRGMDSDPFIRAMNRGDPLQHEMVKTFLRRLRRLLNKVVRADPKLAGVSPLPRRDSDPPSPPRPPPRPVLVRSPSWQSVWPRSHSPTLRTRPHSPASIQPPRSYSPVSIQPSRTYSPVSIQPSRSSSPVSIQPPGLYSPAPIQPPRMYSPVPIFTPMPYIPPPMPYSPVSPIPSRGPIPSPSLFTPGPIPSQRAYSPVTIPPTRMYSPVPVPPPVSYQPVPVPPPMPYSPVPIPSWSYVPRAITPRIPYSDSEQRASPYITLPPPHSLTPMWRSPARSPVGTIRRLHSVSSWISYSPMRPTSVPLPRQYSGSELSQNSRIHLQRPHSPLPIPRAYTPPPWLPPPSPSRRSLMPHPDAGSSSDPGSPHPWPEYSPLHRPRPYYQSSWNSELHYPTPRPPSPFPRSRSYSGSSIEPPYLRHPSSPIPQSYPPPAWLPTWTSEPPYPRPLPPLRSRSYSDSSLESPYPRPGPSSPNPQSYPPPAWLPLNSEPPYPRPLPPLPFPRSRSYSDSSLEPPYPRPRPSSPIPQSYSPPPLPWLHSEPPFPGLPSALEGPLNPTPRPLEPSPRPPSPLPRSGLLSPPRLRSDFPFPGLQSISEPSLISESSIPLQRSPSPISRVPSELSSDLALPFPRQDTESALNLQSPFQRSDAESSGDSESSRDAAIS